MAPICRRYLPTSRKINDKLIKSGFNITSQGGEDGVIQEIFKIIDKHYPDLENKTKWCVEFGAWDGHHLSNTWNLLNNHNWNGVLIEANSDRCNEMKERYKNMDDVICLEKFIEFEGINSLDSILQSINIPKKFDLISIDIDGADYHIWDSLRDFLPKVVVIEFNPTIPNNVSYIQERDMNVYQGSSLRSLIELGKIKGYELICTTTFNAFFVDQSLFSLFEIQDNSIDSMHNVSMPTEFFQLYDGTIKITGCKKLIWKKIPIQEKQLQILPSSKRSFPFAPGMFENTVSTALNHAHECEKKDTKDPEFFMNCGTYMLKMQYPMEDIWKVFQLAVKHAIDEPIEQKRVILDLCLTNVKDNLMKKEQFEESITWLQEMLYFLEEGCLLWKLKLMTLMGEVCIRNREIHKAIFWLRTVLSINPNHAPALKSLAKAYGKRQNITSQKQVLDLLKNLQQQHPFVDDH